MSIDEFCDILPRIDEFGGVFRLSMRDSTGKIFLREVSSSHIRELVKEGIERAIEKEFSSMVVDGSDAGVTFDEFPYYLNEHTKEMLISAAYVKFMREDSAKFTRNLCPAGRNILLSGPSEGYMQMLARSLADFFNANLFMLNIDDFYSKIWSKYGILKSDSPCRWKICKKIHGRMCRLLGSSSTLSSQDNSGGNKICLPCEESSKNNIRSVSYSQEINETQCNRICPLCEESSKRNICSVSYRQEINEIRCKHISSGRGNICLPCGKSSKNNISSLSYRQEINDSEDFFVCLNRNLLVAEETLHKLQMICEGIAELICLLLGFDSTLSSPNESSDDAFRCFNRRLFLDENLFIQTLHKVLVQASESKPLVLYISSTENLLLKQSRMYSLLERMLKSLSGRVLIIGSRTLEGTVDGEEKLAHLFPYNLMIRPPEEDEGLALWTSLKKENRIWVKSQASRNYLLDKLEENNLHCYDLGSVFASDTRVLRDYIEEVLLSAIRREARNQYSYRDGKLIISSNSLNHSLKIFLSKQATRTSGGTHVKFIKTGK